MRLRHNAARLQMRICERARSRVGRGGGGGGAQTERAKEQTKPVRNCQALSLLMKAPPQWDWFILRDVPRPPQSVWAGVPSSS